jgi:hypothetical protein
MGARCLHQEARTALGVLLNKHVSIGNFIDIDGYEEEEDHNFGPDASTLKKLCTMCSNRSAVTQCSAWPFLAEPNPTLMDLIKKELIEKCRLHGIIT